ncbi:MAG: mechanosensitive ion channel [Bacteriovoracaceae bacterium]|jgi:small conductance mechanosensitive channel|nr:mechanosensitive ion channel [Bacteriovoracaceae bacterium]
MQDVNKYFDTAIELTMTYAPKVLLAIATLVVGMWIVRMAKAVLEKQLKKSGMDESLRPFLVGLVSNLLKVIVVISVAGMVGIQTTSFVAVLGAAGLAVGMALQGSLGNFAGSVLILIFKPYKVGDYISVQGHEGVVQEIQIFCTKILTVDNIVVFVPNGAVAGGAIKNVTYEDIRRVDFTFGIGYGDSIDEAKKVFADVAASCDKILKDKEVDVFVSNLNDSSVDFAVRPWCKTADYWDVFFYMNENVKKQLDAKGISIPFPQRDIHVHNVQ